MGIARSSSASQIQRKISGSLVGPQQQHHHQRQHSPKHRRWPAQVAITMCLLVLLLYLGIYLSALSAALNHAKVTNTLPKTEHRINEPRTSKDTKKQQQRQDQQRALHKDAVENEPSVRKGSGANNNQRKEGAKLKQQQLQPPAVASIAGGKETLVLSTAIGDIRIVLRPDLSKETVGYVKQVVSTQSCNRCNFYRAEKPGILQGILASQSVPHSNVKGSCPPGYDSIKNDCPEWDASCGCHGPTMTKGMVGWAAGKTGPDFFIDAYPKTASWWGTQHTVWGELQDPASFAVLDAVWMLPTYKQGGLTYLNEPLHFETRLETES